MNSGIFLIDKPVGISSAQAIARVKKQVGAKKIGHAGTLDPGASGLLVCLTERATKLAHFAEAGKKKYSGTIRFGVTTHSDDLSGEVLSTSDKRPEWDEVLSAAKEFLGEIEQIPPQVSALKVDGQRAYQRVRKGETVELAPRRVTVEEFLLERRSVDEAVFTVTCSKGTYIRSLARDLGASLGCGGCLATLRREASYPFFLKDARPLEEISTKDLLAWPLLFPRSQQIIVSAKEAAALENGNEKTIAEIARRLPTRPDASHAVCVEEASLQPLGLFVYEDCWRFGMHLGR